MGLCGFVDSTKSEQTNVFEAYIWCHQNILTAINYAFLLSLAAPATQREQYAQYDEKYQQIEQIHFFFGVLLRWGTLALTASFSELTNESAPEDPN